MDNFFKNNGFVGGITIIVIGLAILVILWNKFVSKRSSGRENMNSQMNWYSNSQTMTSSNPAPIVNNSQNSKPTSSNELLPKDTNSEWAQLNPSGLGELSNINLLKSGWQVGVDTVGQSLRNANLQLRSEPPNPQTPVGPWNQSTITPDFMRIPLELGQGYQ